MLKPDVKCLIPVCGQLACHGAGSGVTGVHTGAPGVQLLTLVLLPLIRWLSESLQFCVVITVRLGVYYSIIYVCDLVCFMFGLY